MFPRSRNLAVGLFMLVALGLLGWMIVMFGIQPHWLSRDYVLRMSFPSAGPIVESSDVKAAGVIIGRVKDIQPEEDFSKVLVTANIDRAYDIPLNSRPVIRPVTLGLGKPYIDMQIPVGPAAGYVPRDGQTVLEGAVLGGLEELIPPETRKTLDALPRTLLRAAEGLERVTADLHALLKQQPLPTDGAATAPPPNVSSVVQRLDEALIRLNRLLASGAGDVEAILVNVRETTANARQVSESLKGFTERLTVVADHTDKTVLTAQEQLKRVGDSLVDATARLAGILDKLNISMQAVADGRGTVGKLLNDPQLYENLLLTADRLNKTIADLQQLVQQWQAKGIFLKLK